MIADLLDRCPALRILVTSRIPLHLSMEHAYEVPPLPVPASSDEDGELDADLERIASVALFVERARANDPRLEFDDEDRRIVASICERLDGIPLAIELAAARVRHMPLSVLHDRLEDPLPLLTRGPVDAPERHRTQRRAIEWSYELLDAESATVFGRLGVFRGTFGLAAAHVVAGHRASDSEQRTLEILSALVDRSLLRVAPLVDEEPRFTMHDTIRCFAAERMGDADEVANRHRDWFLALAERADARLRGSEQARYRRILEADLENLRTALRRAAAGRDDALLRLAAALGTFWRLHGDLREGERWLTIALEASQGGDPIVRAKARRRLATISDRLGDRGRSRSLYAEAAATAEAVDDREGLAEALSGIGMVALKDGDEAAAAAPIERAMAVARSTTDPRVIAPVLRSRAMLERSSHDVAEASALFEETAREAVRIGDRRLAGLALVDAAAAQLAVGEADEAVAQLSDGIAKLEESEAAPDLGSAHLLLGLALSEQGDLDGARDRTLEGIQQSRECGAAEDIIFGLEVAAEWLGAAGAAHLALQAWAAAEAAREQRGLPEQRHHTIHFEPARERDRSATSKDRADGAWVDGSRLDLDEALDEAVAAVRVTSPPKPRRTRSGAPARDGLTRRELEVLALVVAGGTDAAIAEELFISRKTASVHVSNIKSKLQAANRVEIATMAIRRDLVGPNDGSQYTDVGG